MFSPLPQNLHRHRSHERHSRNQPAMEPDLSAEPTASQTNESGRSRRNSNESVRSDADLKDCGLSRQPPIPEGSTKPTLLQSTASDAKTPGTGGFSIFPIARAGPGSQADGDIDSTPASLIQKHASTSSPAVTIDGEVSFLDKQPCALKADSMVVDRTYDKHPSGGMDRVASIVIEDGSSTNVGSPIDKGRPLGSKTGGTSYGAFSRPRPHSGRQSPSPKTPSHLMKRSKVVKNLGNAQPQLLSLPLGNSGVSTARAPSEEDLYFLLLHRYRKREQTEKQLAARLQELESEKAELCEAAEHYRQRLEASTTSCNIYETQIRAQEVSIDEIKDGFLRIKNYMTQVENDQRYLIATAASIDQHGLELRNHRGHIQQSVEEAQEAATSSSNSLKEVQTQLADLLRESAQLEMCVHDAKLELKNNQISLTEERRRSAKYENHIAEITTGQTNFSIAVQQEQKKVLTALQCIKTQLSNLEAVRIPALSPPDPPALDQCVEMLTALTKVETASPADITDVIQVVQGLTDRYSCATILPVLY
jgi:hypothetical protein